MLPLQTAPYDFPNATAPVPPAWEYVPATQYIISFTPSKAAWTSQWPRDNIWRQSINLYLITWYASSSPFPQTHTPTHRNE
jgi:hypothetical protein